MSLVKRLIVAMLASATGCAQPKSIPKDFMFELSSQAVHPAEPSSLMMIKKKDENSGYEWILQWDDQVSRKDLADTTIAAIVEEIRDKKIFRLKSAYANYHVLDGGTQVLRIRINKREKVIQMRNHRPEELQSVLRMAYDAGRTN